MEKISHRCGDEAEEGYHPDRDTGLPDYPPRDRFTFRTLRSDPTAAAGGSLKRRNDVVAASPSAGRLVWVESPRYRGG